MITTFTNANQPLDALLKRYSNVFDAEKILDRVDARNLTEKEKGDLLSLPMAMIENARCISELLSWLIRYHTETETNQQHVSNVRLLLAIDQMETMKADLLSHAYGCIERCNQDSISCYPANKLIDELG